MASDLEKLRASLSNDPTVRAIEIGNYAREHRQTSQEVARALLELPAADAAPLPADPHALAAELARRELADVRALRIEAERRGYPLAAVAYDAETRRLERAVVAADVRFMVGSIMRSRAA